MKKVVLLLWGLCFFSLSACGQKEEEEMFSLTAQEQEAFITQIDTVTEAFYWDYDRDSLTFGSSTVPDATEENERLFAASADCGYPLKAKAGTPSITATAELLHYNGDSAGAVRFVFIGDTLSGLYYHGGYDNEAYSLLERNPFLANGGFSSYENWNGIHTSYQETKGTLIVDGFVSQGQDSQENPINAAIRNGKIELYHLSVNTLSRYRTINPTGGLEAVSATFIQRGGGQESLLAVLLADVTENGDGEGEKTFTRSEKVLLYDEKLRVVGEIPLESERCTALGAADGKLLLFVDKVMETYEDTGDGWQRASREVLRHPVTQCHVTDLDGDGKWEYLMTDGMDLYLYHRYDTGLLKVWSTHLGVESLYGPLYSGDLNDDGVKEIYVADATGTAIRYILTERGLRSSNEDINYGEAIFPCDWNRDGRDDYWRVATGEDRQGGLFLSQPEA